MAVPAAEEGYGDIEFLVLPYGLSPYAIRLRCARVLPAMTHVYAIWLRFVPTTPAYAPTYARVTLCPYSGIDTFAIATAHPVLICNTYDAFLCNRYGMPGTDIAYAATRAMGRRDSGGARNRRRLDWGGGGERACRARRIWGGCQQSWW